MKKFFVTLIIFLMLPALLISCTGKIFSEKSMFAPKPLRMGGPPRDADPDYLQGWDDGCETGLSTMVPGSYKSYYAFKQDPYKIKDQKYYQAWKDAYTYCRQYSFRYAWDAYDRTYDKALENNLCVICPNELDRAQ